MSPKLKLTYFNGRGSAEVIRLLLAHANVDYEAHRVEKEDWPELKKTMQQQQLPLLECNGETIEGPITIARFIAREYNLAGKNSWEMAKVDMIIECLVDMGMKYFPIHMETDAKKKKELMEKYVIEVMANFTQSMEALLVKNGGKCFVGQEVTLADIHMAYTLDTITDMLGSSMWKKDAPNLDKLRQHVLMELPNCKELFASFPPA